MGNYLAGSDVRMEYGGATVTSGSAGVVILGPYDLARYVNKSFTLNNFGTTTLSGAIIQVNPDQQGLESGAPGLTDPNSPRPAPNPGLWENFDTTSFRALVSAGVKTVFVNQNVARWWRIVGVSDLPSTTVSGWLYATSV